MIGRDILIGILAGLLHLVVSLTAGRFALDRLVVGNLAVLDSSPAAAGHLAYALRFGLLAGMMLMMGLMVYTLIFRRRTLAIAATWLTQFGLYLAASTDPRLFVSYAVITTIYVGVAARYGLLAAAAMHTTFSLLLFYPVADGINWYTAVGLVTVIATLALSVWAFRISLGGQSAFSARLLDPQA